MRHGRLIILFVCSFIISNAFAQQNLDYFFRHIDQSDGLLHNQVVSIVQDGRGFIWIATSNGLQRYDGSRFIYYPEMLSDASEGLTYGADMYLDKKNNLLWISKNNSIEKNFCIFIKIKIIQNNIRIFKNVITIVYIIKMNLIKNKY